MLLGVIFGLGAALFQTLSYFGSRWYLHRHEKAGLSLMVYSHIIMGVISLVVIPFVWPTGTIDWGAMWWPVIQTIVGYLFGQAMLFYALLHTEASRIAPMLGVKLIVVGCFAILFVGQEINSIQWLGIILAAGSAFILNYSGGSMPWRAIVAIGFICIGYSCSDLGVQLQVDVLEKMPAMANKPVVNSAFSLTLGYLIMGVMALFFLPLVKNKNKGVARDGLPYSLAWYAGMACLYASFACSNVVLGNMLQASRSVMAIFLGMVFVLMGYEHVEKKISRDVFLRRLLGAVGMMFAITLYLYGAEVA